MKDVAIITGASAGIGKALAIELAKTYKVGLIARRVDVLAELCSEIESKGGDASFRSGDVTDESSMVKAVSEIEADLGPCHLFIANAGISSGIRLKSFSAIKSKSLYDVNLTGVTNSIGAILPQMVERGAGHIVTMSSLAGSIYTPKSFVYASSKAAVDSFAYGLWMAAAKHGISVTNLKPGFVRTDLTAKNNFKMPFMMEPDVAAKKMVKAIARKQISYSFPWQLHYLIKLITCLPLSLQRLIMSK
ncbi:MAG: SDR family NAD(P)-dependent oxidoreductase [Pseudobacteriovorax sp.]|nr:SDR family NAD(P)-dependent oxidoreductase [Pseudobacteriovorax sp.]